MKKYIYILAIYSLFNISLFAEADFYIGSGISQMSAENQANKDRKGLDEIQKGLDFGMRLYTKANRTIDIGGEIGFSHLETRNSISGNILHLQFLLKFHPSRNVELFGGIGAAARGTPDPISSSVKSNSVLFGTLGSIGIAYVTDNEWRFDTTFHYIKFTGTIDGQDETIKTNLFGFHIGKSFNIF